MLNIGEKVFVPNYGAGVVDSIEVKEIQGVSYEYVSVTFVIDDIKIFIPKRILKNIR